MQYGSRFIQQHMETATEQEKADVFAEIEPSAAQLMGDLFGNYVVQKFFEFGSSAQVEILCEVLRGCVFELSLQTYGCRVVQKAIENLPQEAQVWSKYIIMYNATDSKKCCLVLYLLVGWKFWFFGKKLGGKCLFNVVNGACMFTAPISSLYV